MSFILDALRKSETERQRLSQVAIADLPVGRRRRNQPWWVFALGGLLALNLVVLAAVLLRDESAPAQGTQATAAPVAPTTPATATAVPQSTTPALDSNVLQEAADPPQVEYETITREQYEMEAAAASIPDGPTLVRPADSYDTATPAQVSPYPAADADDQLQLNLHVYSRNAEERFVMINMRRYTEGQQLPNGATVEQITPDGVIIYRNGQRYQLNRS